VSEAIEGAGPMAPEKTTAEKAWGAAEQIIATMRDEPDEISVNYVAAVIYDLLRKEERAKT